MAEGYVITVTGPRPIESVGVAGALLDPVAAAAGEEAAS